MSRLAGEAGVNDDRDATLEDPGDTAGPGEELGVARILVKQDGVERIAGRDPAEPAADTAQLRAVGRRGEQRLLNAEPGPVQQGDLGQVVAVIVAMGEVAAERDRHARVPRDGHRLAKPLPHRACAVRPGPRQLASPGQLVQLVVDHQGGHQRAAACCHQRRVRLGEEDAVLDRPRAGLDRLAHRRAAQRVHHHGPAAAGGLGHRRPDLVLAELGGEVSVRPGRQHAAGGEDLDPVRAGPHELADRRAELGRAVGQVGRPARVIGEHVVDRAVGPRAGQEPVAVSPGRPQRHHGHLETWPRHEAGREGVPHAGVSGARVPHERHARRECPAQRVRGLKDAAGQRRAQELKLVEGGHPGMQMAVDDAGEQPQPLAVQARLVRGRAQAAADRRHPAVEHADVHWAGEAAAAV
ncbi:MAG: hypothetical protein JWM19_6404 [Actinomycetia bacterium]|nr:hypothetical protein [Actinomycetes bacterium]